MSEAITLEATPRQITGKQVKQLRRQGQIPATIYGPDFTPMNLSIAEKPLRLALAKAGGTQIIELNVNNQKIPALAREVQRHPLTGGLLHVDFYRVAMDRPIRAEVPVLFVNESPAVASREAIAIHVLTSIEIEALPANLPPHIEVDMSTLTKVGDQLLVSDLNLPETIKVLTEGDELLVKLDYPEAVEEEAPLAEISADAVEVITERKREEEEE